MIRNYLFSILFIMNAIRSFSQNPCLNGRYSTDVYLTASVTTNITYGSNKTYNGSNQVLTLDFYEPPSDTASIRPLIILAHGGAFYQGAKNDQDIVTIAQRLTRKGFTCASINYRLGISPFDSNGAVRASIRAIQDMKAAIRFFHKDRQTLNKYKTDTNNIFIGGSSAGALMSLAVGYLDKTCEITPYLNQNFLDSIGGLEGKSGSECYSTKINGIINLCGTLTKYGWIENGDIPFCSMHGTNDTDVPYGQGILNPGIPIMYSDGSRLLNKQAITMSVTNSFYTWHGAGHMPYLGATPTATAYMDSTIKFVSDFLISRIGCTVSPSLPANSPLGNPNLYAYTTCTLNSTVPCGVTSLIDIKDPLISFKIYPNPTTTSMTIETNSTLTNCSLKIFNINGELLHATIIQKNKFFLNLEDYSPGIYFLQLSNDNQNFTTKVIKQ